LLLGERADSIIAALQNPSSRTASDDGGVTWIGLVRKNLLRRPVRTILTSSGVAIGVGLIVALLSISAGTQRTAGDLIHFGRADFGLFQSGVST
jgi:hypothetical protein